MCLPLLGLGAAAQQGQKAAPKGGQQGSPPGPRGTAPNQSGATPNYPAKPVRILVGFAPGGIVDIVARLVAQALAERLGQAFIIDNRPGAAGTVAAQNLVRAAPDGYTLYLASSANAINQSIYRQLPYNFIRDTEAVAGVIRVANVVLVNASLQTKSLAGFIEQAKARPGVMNWGTAGMGTIGHLSGELFKTAAGVNIVHVPYRSTPSAMSDLIAGQVQVMFDSISTSMPLIKEGKVRALAVTSAARVDTLPDVPTVAETLQGYEASTFYGLSLPTGTPREIIDKLNGAVNAALGDQGVQGRLALVGGTVMPGTPADFGKIIADDTEKWEKVTKPAGITVQ
jgi:tripartite-type tricarboxylate transporter receptor subunit TctC